MRMYKVEEALLASSKISLDLVRDTAFSLVGPRADSVLIKRRLASRAVNRRVLLVALELISIFARRSVPMIRVCPSLSRNSREPPSFARETINPPEALMIREIVIILLSYVFLRNFKTYIKQHELQFPLKRNKLKRNVLCMQIFCFI